MSCKSAVVLLLGGFFGLIMLLATPPLRYPDEQGHFLRAIDLEARWHTNTPDSLSGRVAVPESIARDFERFEARIFDVRKGRPAKFEEIWGPSLDGSVLDGDRRTSRSLEIPVSQMMSNSILYMPQAIAMDMALRLGANFAWTLSSGRLAVLITSLALTIIAIELLPGWAGWIGVAANLIPMACYLRTSLSPDALITGSAQVGIAAILRLAEGQVLRRTIGLALVASVALSLAVLGKPIYLALLPLVLFCWNRKELGTSAVMIAIIIGMPIVSGLWQFSIAAPFGAHLRSDVPPAAFAQADKIQLLLEQPLHVLKIFWQTVWQHGPGMVYSVIGRFGWSDINPSPIMHVLALTWLIAVAAIDADRVRGALRLRGAGLLFGVFMLQGAAVALSLWIAWTETASPIIQGIQGRYFLPAAVCALLGLSACIGVASDGRIGRLVSVLANGWVVTCGAAILLVWSSVSIVRGEYFGILGYSVG